MRCFSALLALLAIAIGRAEESWPHFRGPRSDGSSAAQGVPLTWSETQNVKWKTAIPGEGWSSPIAADGQIWVTTALNDGRSLRAVCVDFASGRIQHDIEVFAPANPPPKHQRNSYASPTGILDGGRLFVNFGSSGTACIDTATGKILWKNQELVVDFQNGPGGSLTHAGDLLLVAFDGTDQQFGVALDKSTGKVAWKVGRSAQPELEKLPGDMRKAYGTPVVLQIDGQPQSLTTGSNRLYALDPKSGAELWHVDYPRGFSNVPVPVSDGRMLVISTGFMKPQLWGIRVGGAKGNATATHVAWKQPAGAPDQSSPSIVDGRVYMVSSGGILSCLDVNDGSIIWKERIGSDFAASPISVKGRLYFFAAAGPCTVIEPGPKFKKLAENTLEEGCMASPAVVGKSLIVRTKTHLYRLEE